jgi:hypothetical protein
LAWLLLSGTIPHPKISPGEDLEHCWILYLEQSPVSAEPYLFNITWDIGVLPVNSCSKTVHTHPRNIRAILRFHFALEQSCPVQKSKADYCNGLGQQFVCSPTQCNTSNLL